MDHYLNQTELDTGMQALATAYPDDCELIDLPNQSFEKRTIRAIRIRRKSANPPIGILLIGSIHAREWGGADILFYLASDLLAAFTANKDLLYQVPSKGPGRTFTAADLARLRDRLDLFIVPCVNPDGRIYSMTKDSLWRKNRKPGTSGVGVDLNRNFDFLWDYKKYFASSVWSTYSMPSDSPTSDMFHGTAVNSEPETKNIVWLFDQYPQIRYFIDVHSYTGDVLTAWGDAPNQTSNPSMNFRNPTYDGKRGVDATTKYGEFIKLGDLNFLGTCITEAIADVTGEEYEVHQGFYLAPGSAGGTSGKTYPTSGTSDDYATSRALANPVLTSVSAFTIEFHKSSSNDMNYNFHPPFPEMADIIAEIDAGLVAFCMCATAQPIKIHIPALVAEILFGVTADGGGVVVIGGKPVPVGPWDPLVAQLAAGLRVYYDAAALPAAEGRVAMHAALEAMVKAVDAARGRI
jgi:murein tripeptide amidase MpaA